MIAADLEKTPSNCVVSGAGSDNSECGGKANAGQGVFVSSLIIPMPQSQPDDTRTVFKRQ